jgi:general secretion pathway protein D
MHFARSRKSSFVAILLVFVVMFLPWDLVSGEERQMGGDESSLGPKPGQITMNFKDVDMGVLIRFISELTGKNFVVDPSVRGRVTILSPQKVSIDEAYKVFLSVLEVNGFTTVPAGRVIKIIKSADAKGKGTETVFQKAMTPEDKVITQLCPLRFGSVSEMAKTLKPLVPRTGLLIPYTETNTLIIIDVLSNIDRLLRIIRELDVPGIEEIKVYRLEYARAEKLAPTLLGVFQEKKRRKTAVTEQIKLIPDERTNSLIVLANPKTRIRIQNLIEELDRKETKPRANIHIYRLENAVAEDIVKVLSEIPGKGAGGDKDQKNKTPVISKNVQISADKATNTLVIIAEPEEYDILEGVIEKLDVDRAMVYVEALIMEVSADKALDLGVEWRVGNEYNGGFGEGSDGGVWLGGSRGGTSLLSTLEGGNLPSGFAAGVIGQAITVGGVTFPSIAAFVRAVRTDSDFNIISTPQILTLDNEEASIEVGQNIPFVTQQQQPSDPALSTTQTFEYKDVGVTLKVTPHINEAGFVRLKVEESIKNVLSQTALGGTVLAPTTTYRTVIATITVGQGETAVIGGLIEDEMNRSKTQTPCLGGLPVLGWAFKNVNDQDNKTNLMVFLTPHILDNTETRRALYRDKKEYIDKEVEKSQTRNQSERIRRMAIE